MKNILINNDHKALANIGTLTHATIDSYLDQSVKVASSPTFAGLISTLKQIITNAVAGVAGLATQINTGNPQTEGLIIKGATATNIAVQPNALSGAKLEAWWKADAIVGLNDGDLVASWTDSSGNGRTLTQTVAGSKPTYKTNILNSLPAVRFDGTASAFIAQYMGTAITSNHTVFAVLSHRVLVSAYKSPYVYIESTGTNHGGYYMKSTGKSACYPHFNSGGSYDGTGASTYSAGEYHIHEMQFNPSSTSYVWKNGVLDNSFASGAISAGSYFVIGNDPGVGGRFLDGDILEFIVFSGNLTASQRNAIELYLSAKYNIAVTALASAPQAANLQELQSGTGANLVEVLGEGQEKTTYNPGTVAHNFVKKIIPVATSPQYAFYYDGATYSVSSNMMADTDEYVYYGNDTQFRGLEFVFSVLGAGYTINIEPNTKYEFWNGSAWTAFTYVNQSGNTIKDRTSNLTISNQPLTWVIPSTWAKTTVNSISAYWVRMSTSTIPSRVAVTAQVNVMGIGNILEVYNRPNAAAPTFYIDALGQMVLDTIDYNVTANNFNALKFVNGGYFYGAYMVSPAIASATFPGGMALANQAITGVGSLGGASSLYLYTVGQAHVMINMNNQGNAGQFRWGGGSSTSKWSLLSTGFQAIGERLVPVYPLTLNGNAVIGDSASLSTEKVANGNFTTVPDTSWTGWTAYWVHDTTNFEADHLTGSAATLSQNISCVAGEMYYLSFTVKNYSAGSITPTLGGVAGVAVSENIVSNQIIVATTTGNLIFTPSSTFVGTIDDVSVKKMTSGNLTLAGSLNVAGAATHLGSMIVKSVTDAGPMTATNGTVAEIVFNTSDSKFYGCTVTGTPATWVALN